MCNVVQTAREVAGVSRLESRIGKTLTSTVRGDEVFKVGQTFLEVRDDGILDEFCAAGAGRLLRLSHETTHTGKLTDLLLRAPCLRVHHHVEGVEPLLV